MDKEANNEAEKIKAEYEALVKLEAEYKIKYGVIAKISTTAKDGRAISCYFKEPHRMSIGVAMACIDEDVIKGLEIIFDGSIVTEISPDWESFRNDAGSLGGASANLQRLCSLKKSTYTPL